MSFFLRKHPTLLQSGCAMLYSINCDWWVCSPHSCIDTTIYPINSEGLRIGLQRPFFFFFISSDLYALLFWSHFCWRAGPSSSLCLVLFERLCLYIQWAICLLNAVAVKTDSSLVWDPFVCVLSAQNTRAFLQHFVRPCANFRRGSDMSGA